MPQLWEGIRRTKRSQSLGDTGDKRLLTDRLHSRSIPYTRCLALKWMSTTRSTERWELFVLLWLLEYDVTNFAATAEMCSPGKLFTLSGEGSTAVLRKLALFFSPLLSGQQRMTEYPAFSSTAEGAIMWTHATASSSLSSFYPHTYIGAPGPGRSLPAHGTRMFKSVS